MSPTLLSLHGINKRFGRVEALRGVALAFAAGEVHALLGENGAGKSTLMHIVYGMLRPDAGEIRLRGEPVVLRSPRDARRAGIGMVHQEFALIDALSVAENLTLALSPDDDVLWHRARVCAAAARLADEVGLELGDLDAPAGSLPVGMRQRVEIVKALAGRTEILILDEPTAVLTPAETAQLFRVLDLLRSRGTAVLFITHRLSEVMDIADRITVMRRGEVVATMPRANASAAGLAELMVGALPERGPRRAPRAPAGAVAQLALDGVSVDGSRGGAGLRECTLALQPGEIFGVAGVDGNGQSELFEVLVGLRAPAAGTIAVAGTRVTRFAPDAMLAAGIGHIPPDRRRQGVVPQMSVADNAVLNRPLLRRLARGPFLQPAACRRVAQSLVDRYAIKADGLEMPAGSLSGGNLQRLIAARALSLQPRVLVAFNPTRGLDIAAARAVYDALDAALAGGAAVLLISTDLDEILAVCDRLAVLSRGHLSAELTPPVSTEQLGLLMAGSA